MSVTVVYREEIQVTTQVIRVKCNPCGKEAPADGGSIPYGFHRIPLEGGWGDRFPGDTEVFDIITCEDCLRKWVGSFADPNVSVGSRSGLWSKTHSAWHAETNREMTVDGCYLYPAGEEPPKGLKEPELPEEDYPFGGVWRHFKGNLYQVLDLAWDVHTLVPHVIYRALYGESKVWCRPLPEWAQHVDRTGYAGPRFTKV